MMYFVPYIGGGSMPNMPYTKPSTKYPNRACDIYEHISIFRILYKSSAQLGFFQTVENEIRKARLHGKKNRI